MEILSDDEWARLKAALDAVRSGTGRPFPDERRTVEAVIWRQRNGAKWRSLPPELGPWWKAAQLHIRWSRRGIWAAAFEEGLLRVPIKTITAAAYTLAAADLGARLIVDTAAECTLTLPNSLPAGWNIS